MNTSEEKKVGLVPFMLANIISDGNNYDEGSVRMNMQNLNNLWDKLTDDEQEQYCSQFNSAKETLSNNLLYYSYIN